MARQNYKVYANIGVTRKALTKFAIVLDTGAGSRFIRPAVIPDRLQRHIPPNPNPNNIRDANGRKVSVDGMIDLVVEIGTRAEVVQFKVNERLGTNVILVCDFCNKYVKEIRMCVREVQLDDGTIIPIIKPATKRVHKMIPLPEPQVYETAKIREINKVKVTKIVTLEPGVQTWVEVVSQRTGKCSSSQQKRYTQTTLAYPELESTKLRRTNLFTYSSSTLAYMR